MVALPHRRYYRTSDILFQVFDRPLNLLDISRALLKQFFALNAHNTPEFPFKQADRGIVSRTGRSGSSVKGRGEEQPWISHTVEVSNFKS